MCLEQLFYLLLPSLIFEEKKENEWATVLLVMKYVFSPGDRFTCPAVDVILSMHTYVTHGEGLEVSSFVQSWTD